MADNDILITEDGTRIVWAHADDFDNNPWADTDELDFSAGAAGLADGAAREGDSVDLGAERAQRYRLTLNMEIDAAPASGEVVDLYWAPSEDNTAFPGGVSGSDGAYTGTAGDSLADSLKQLVFVGSLICTADADPVEQQQSFVFVPSAQYGAPVVFNQSGQSGVTDGDNMYLSMMPLIDEIQ